VKLHLHFPIPLHGMMFRYWSNFTFKSVVIVNEDEERHWHTDTQQSELQFCNIICFIGVCRLDEDTGGDFVESISH